MLIEFSKMHGLGNDFMVVETLSAPFKPSTSQIKAWSDRHRGIGFDQLLVVGPPSVQHADFTYQVFNADGSEVAQCGNGARCLAKYIKKKRLSPKPDLTLETQAGLLYLKWQTSLVEVSMGVPNFQPEQIPLNTDHPDLRCKDNGFFELDLPDQAVEFQAVSIGNPHMVIRVPSLKNAPIESLGPLLESHPIFPERVNVGFVEVKNEASLALRVYERGAGETQACGSGACAAMVVSARQGWVGAAPSVHLTGGELSMTWKGDGTPVFMKGDATHVFEGIIDVPDMT